MEQVAIGTDNEAVEDRCKKFYSAVKVGNLPKIDRETSTCTGGEVGFWGVIS